MDVSYDIQLCVLAVAAKPQQFDHSNPNLSFLFQKKEKAANYPTRQVLQKKFKIDDGSSKYVETATLLEPSNNNASTQNEMEELREVSQQLMEIKKKHDEARKQANKKQDDLEKVKKEID